MTGGPGMIFSRETLRRMVPNIKDCIKNLYSTHEDVEVHFHISFPRLMPSTGVDGD